MWKVFIFHVCKMECDKSSRSTLTSAFHPQRPSDTASPIHCRPSRQGTEGRDMNVPLNVEGAYPLVRKLQALVCLISQGGQRETVQSGCTVEWSSAIRLGRSVGLRQNGACRSWASQLDIKTAGHRTGKAQYSTMETKYGNPYVISPTEAHDSTVIFLHVLHIHIC